jgi:hypothetical protein
MQLVNEISSSDKLRFGHERKAQEFANNWRKQLWATHFDHPDPVHNAAAEAERVEARK